MNLRAIAEWFVQGDVPRDAGAMTLVFERPMPAWAWLLVGVGLFLIALWSYRRLQGTGKPLSRAMRGVLVVLRASVLLLIAFLIAGPSLRFERSRIEADRLVVLLDRSRSLAIADAPGGVSREQQLRGFLGGAQPVLDQIAGIDAQAKPEEGERRGKDIDYVGFSGGAFSLGATGGKVVDALGTPEGERTDLDAAIRQSITRNAGQPLSGVLVVSDGRSAVPVSPETLRLLERDAVRVFTVALGSNDRIGDAAIVSAESPARAFVRDRVPTKASVIITRQPGRTISAANVQAIIQLVSSSVPYLAPENVSVVDNYGSLMNEMLTEQPRPKHPDCASNIVTPDSFDSEITLGIQTH